ncbi:hypothetical protein E0H70_25525 [Rhizobium leguminosarum bv. viciae]|nr:hypothetical protein E0H70_25525 [Rhizobium leguminosarum bv. viciae]
MRLLFFVLALIAAMPRLSLADDETVQWKEVGGWKVVVDKTLGNGCFVLTSFEDGTVFRLGFNYVKKESPFYILIGNVNWKSLEDGKQYPLEFYLDRSKWTVDASAVDLDGFKALWIDFKDSSLVAEFARKLSFRATFNGKEIVALSLKNSVKATDEMLACQKAVNAAVAQQPALPQSKDPFEAKPGTQASDPFDL